MEAQKGNIFSLFFYIIFIIMILFIVKMIYSIFKQEDERRKMIIMMASTNTFYITISILILDLVLRIIGYKLNNDSIILLTIISIIYSINLFRYKKKFGD